MGVEKDLELQARARPDQETLSPKPKILQPNLVLSAVIVLGVCALTGLGVGASTFESSGWHSVVVVAAQASIVTSSCCAISYIIAHLVAAYRNEACGEIRPPVLKLHEACFIIARIDFVLWAITIVVSSIALSKNGVCTTRGPDCKSEIISTTVSSIAFIANGIILAALEACQYPFQPPYALGIQKTPPPRQRTPYGNVAMGAPQLRTVDNVHREGRRAANSTQEARKHQSNKDHSSTTMEEPYPFRSLLPLTQAPRSRWGEEWKHLAQGPTKSLTKSDSAVSGLSRSSSGYMSMSSESASIGRKPPRVVSPSSSIRNQSRRSPLSTVRSADHPELAVRPELRYCPPKVPSHERSLSRTSSLPQPLPVAEIQRLQRRSSVATKLCPIRQPRLPPLTHQRLQKRTGYMIKRRNSNPRFPNGYRLSIEQEKQLGVHATSIEIILRSKSQSDHDSKPRPSPKTRSGKKIERKNLPVWSPFHQKIDSRARYREQRPIRIARSHTTSGSRELGALTSNPLENYERTIPKVAPLRRLSLGDISTGFGRIF